MATSRLFRRSTYPEASRVAQVLRSETTGGLLLMAAAVAALAWANSPAWRSYASLAEQHLGPLTLTHWSSDGLLAIFFFVAGLELKREFVAGDLRDPARAALPVVAAVGGMVTPAVIYLLVGAPGRGWAIPTATDIAFTVAVLALVSTHLPSGLRTFLLTLAVVDDLLAIAVIAVFYTSQVHLAWLALALVPVGAFGVLAQRRVRAPLLLLPLALAAWWCVHESGIHATVAGVLLAFTVPVERRSPGPGPGLAEHFEHRLRPLSAGVAVPVFAFFAAGVHVGGWRGLTAALGARVTLGVVAGLVAGKAAGIAGSTWLLATFTKAELDDELGWVDVIGMALLGGIGFTVSLLIGGLAFGEGSVYDEHVKVGVLAGSLLAALLAAAVLGVRNRVYRSLVEAESVDTDNDGLPDVFQEDR